MMGAAIMSNRSSTLADDTAARRYQSFLLADELRQSSDDLTRLARTYVVSGDAKWEKQYLEIVGIRDGRLPYWSNTNVKHVIYFTRPFSWS